MTRKKAILFSTFGCSLILLAGCILFGHSLKETMVGISTGLLFGFIMGLIITSSKHLNIDIALKDNRPGSFSRK